jgi:acyl-CoA thioesterase-1
MRPDEKAAVAAPYGVGFPASNRAAALIAAVLLAFPAVAETRIAAFGDSLTQGYGLPEEEGFVPQLEAWLAEQGKTDVRVINAGVSGDTTAGGRARIDWTLADEPDAVIVALGGNDLLRGLDPAETRANLDAILARLDAEGIPVLLAGLPGPTNYGPDFKAEFDAIWPELAAEYDAILHPNFLSGIGESPAEARASGLMQEDGIHPNAAGVRAMVEAIGPRVIELIERARAEAVAGSG